MIEAIAVPLLVKAIDFLFDESKKILEERRMRRQAESENKVKKDEQKEKQLPTIPMESAVQPVPQINTKQTALSTSVDKTRWGNSEKEITHLLELCEIYKTNLYHAKEKYARFGRDYAPPHLLHEIKEAEDGVLDAAKRLNNLLTQIYDKEIIVPDLDLES